MSQPRSEPAIPLFLGLSLVLVGLIAACPSTPPAPPFPPEPSFPDDGGVLIEKEPACTLTGDLTIGLGESDGIDEFRPLPAGQGPTVHYGSQGGIHVILGASVANPALDFPGVQVRFILEAQMCEVNGCTWQVMGQYTSVVNKDRYIPQSQGVAVSGFFILLRDWPRNSPRRVTTEVYDKCGRRGTTTLQLAGGVP
jgi:hypothetical protein